MPNQMLHFIAVLRDENGDTHPYDVHAYDKDDAQELAETIAQFEAMTVANVDDAESVLSDAIEL